MALGRGIPPFAGHWSAQETPVGLSEPPWQQLAAIWLPSVSATPAVCGTVNLIRNVITAVTNIEQTIRQMRGEGEIIGSGRN